MPRTDCGKRTKAASQEGRLCLVHGHQVIVIPKYWLQTRVRAPFVIPEERARRKLALGTGVT